MSEAIEVKVPDIGDYKDVPVIEILVKAGDSVEKEQSLVTLESDKATMDVPSPHAGTVKEVKVKQGDSVSEGTLIVLLEPAGGGAQAAKPAQANGAAAPAAPSAPAAAAPASSGGVQEVKVPDIGDYKDVPVIEVAVKPGDRVEKEQSLVTLESDKATMDVPSPVAGVVKEVKVKVGDAVSEGTLIVLVEAQGATAPAAAPAAPAKAAPAPADAPRDTTPR
ncbi:biotin/lipoyl-containing protein, partial [Trinickia diaoshuihuensis]|uniref:biotin/lipoyl-containing protein n=1 Tax=Trinickia diaoshuihuensis TaxID=2292265 RepID=UPI0030B82249